MKRKVSFNWYIPKRKETKTEPTNSSILLSIPMPRTKLQNLYSRNCCHDNNENDDNKQLHIFPHNKLFTKLGKLNMLTQNGETETETETETKAEGESIQNNQTPKQEKQEKQEPGRKKSTEYYYNHREEKLEYQKHYNREKGDAIKDYNKNYYMKRREEILEKAKTKITCECGCVVQLFNMNSHKKTKKHVRCLEMRAALAAALARAVSARETNTTE